MPPVIIAIRETWPCFMPVSKNNTLTNRSQEILQFAPGFKASKSHARGTNEALKRHLSELWAERSIKLPKMPFLAETAKQKTMAESIWVRLHLRTLEQEAPYLIKVRGFLLYSVTGFEHTTTGGCCGDGRVKPNFWGQPQTLGSSPTFVGWWFFFEMRTSDQYS